MDVSPAQVEQPCNLVQRGQHQHIHAVPRHMLSQARHFLLSGGAHTRRVHLKNRLMRKGGAICPNLAHQIRFGGKRDVFWRGFRGKTFGKRLADGTPVKTDHAPLLHRFGKEGANLRHAGLPVAHQLNAGALQLRACLQKVTSVRPQQRPVGEHYQGAGGAGKAGQPRAGFEILPRVFGGVKIVGQDNVSIHAVRRHPGAQGIQFFRYRHQYYPLSPPRQSGAVILSVVFCSKAKMPLWAR